MVRDKNVPTLSFYDVCFCKTFPKKIKNKKKVMEYALTQKYKNLMCTFMVINYWQYFVGTLMPGLPEKGKIKRVARCDDLCTSIKFFCKSAFLLEAGEKGEQFSVTSLPASWQTYWEKNKEKFIR